MNVNALYKVSIIFSLFCLSTQLSAQTPGGIPSEDLKLWLMSEAGVTEDGSGNISSWQDQINGETFIQTDIASQPTLQTNAINNNPAILFDGTDDALGSTFNFDASSAMSVIRVVKPNDADGVLFYQGSTNNFFDRSPVVFQNGSFEYVPQSSNSSLGLVDETAYDGLPKILSLVRFGPRNSFIFRDGKLEKNERLASPPIDMTFDTTVIGVNPSRLIERPSDPLYFDGIVSEIIILESSISLPLQQRLESYLAIKYGITLDNTDNADHVIEGNYINAVDEVVWDVTQNLIYHHNVIGIAKDETSSLDQTKSSNSALTDPRLTIAHDDINAPLSLNDGQYFIVGDDNVAFEEVDFEITDTIGNRIGTVWKVQNTGDVTNVSLAIDISGVTLANGTSQLEDFNLIINENGTQIFEENLYRGYLADSIVSDIVYFSGVTINDGETFSMSTYVNNAPIAVNDTIKLTEDDLIAEDKSLVTINSIIRLIENDRDPEGVDTSIVAVNKDNASTTEGNFGTLTWTANGTYAYELLTIDLDSLESHEMVVDSFEYVITDQNLTDTAYFFIEIQGVNDKPVTFDDDIDIYEDSSSYSSIDKNENLKSNDFDAESIDSSYIYKFSFDALEEDDDDIDVVGLYGSVNWDSTGTFVYTLNPLNPNGLDTLQKDEVVTETFSYILDDGDGLKDTADFVVWVHGQNDAPVAVSDTVKITEDIEEIDDASEGLNLLANDSDIDGDELIITEIVETNALTHTGTYGELTLTSTGGFVYDVDTTITNTLEDGVIVYDEFEYVVFDQVDSTDTVLFVVEITGINDKPIANNDTLTLLEDDVTFETNLTAEDDSLLANDIDYESLDSSFVANITFDATTVNTTNAGLTNEIDGLYGTLYWDSTGNVMYERNSELDSLYKDEEVADTFSYVLDDGDGASDIAKLIIEIIGENDAPIAMDDSLEMAESDLVVISTDTDSLLVNDTDPDGDNLSIISVNEVNLSTSPATIIGEYGSLALNLEDGSYTYTSNQDVTNTIPQDSTAIDSFVYVIDDGLDATDTALFKVKIAGENDAPVAENDNIIIDDSTLVGRDIIVANSVLENDSDIDIDDVITVNQIRHGGIAVIDASTPLQGNFGELAWDEDGNFVYTFNNPDIDTLVPGESVIDSFYYQITDDATSSLTDEALFRVVIEGTNYAPVAVNDTADISEGDDQIEAGITVDVDSMLVNDNFGDDPEEQTITIISVNDEATNTIEGLYGDLTWQADGHYVYEIDSARASVIAYQVIENDEFKYVIQDDFNDTDTATLVIRVEGINSPPAALNDIITLSRSDQEGMINLLTNDTDDGQVITVTSIDNNTDVNSTIQGAYGSFVWTADGDITYTLQQNTVANLTRDLSVVDSFLYFIEDDNVQEDSAYLFVIINGEDYEISNSQGFTPNGDRDNDEFQILGYSYVEGEFSKLSVFSPRGTLVYDASPYENNWNGISNQGGIDKVDPGVYYFVLETEVSSPIKGYVFINY